MLSLTPRTALATALLVLLATLLPAASVQAGTQVVGSQTVTQSVSKYQNQARTATNDKRAAHGRAKLHRSACVQRFARKQARRMADQNRMFHQRMRPILNRCNLRAVGENVAYGYPTGRSVVRAWMHSAGHRANILNRQYRLLGMAMRRSDNGTPYAAQVFGRRR